MLLILLKSQTQPSCAHPVCAAARYEPSPVNVVIGRLVDPFGLVNVIHLFVMSDGLLVESPSVTALQEYKPLGPLFGLTRSFQIRHDTEQLFITLGPYTHIALPQLENLRED